MATGYLAALMRSRIFIITLLLLTGVAAGLGLGRALERRGGGTHALVPVDAIRAKPGPWGDLYYSPFTISAPDEAIPIRALEAHGTHWMFLGKTETQVRQMLESAGISMDDRDELLDPEVSSTTPQGVEMAPTYACLNALSSEVRGRLYQVLAQFPENGSALTYIHKDDFADKFRGSACSDETVAKVRKLCCEHGDYLVLSGLEVLLGQIPSYEEKVGLVKALTRQKTMLFRLFIGPNSDTAALASYWGKGSHATDVKTMLQSLATVKGGTWIDILMVLPPLPSSELYFYPLVADIPLSGPPPVRDCHWSSFNFFRDKPDPDLNKPEKFMAALRDNYYPAPGDPRYGDLVLFTKPDGTAIHSAIYLADDIVFTKNGDTPIHPWMLSSINDLLRAYTFQVPPGEHLTVSYFRNRSL